MLLYFSEVVLAKYGWQLYFCKLEDDSYHTVDSNLKRVGRRNLVCKSKSQALPR